MEQMSVNKFKFLTINTTWVDFLSFKTDNSKTETCHCWILNKQNTT